MFDLLLLLALFLSIASGGAVSEGNCTKPCRPIPLLSPRCLVGSLGEQICIGNGSVVMMTDADALVNAANNVLHDDGGVAAAFVQCGGQVIQQEADALIAKTGPLAVAETAVTSAGCLQARDLINAVGPRWGDGPDDIVKHQLRDTMFNVLRTARLLCDSHVAVPLISAGIFGFGNELSADILLQAVFDFYLYWYQTPYGQFSAADIERARNLTRFPSDVRNCSGQLMPSKITIVAFYETPSDMHVLTQKLDALTEEMAALRKTFGNGTFTSSTNSWTPPTAAPTPTPVPTTATTATGPVPSPTPGECMAAGMPCWALGLLIALAVVIVCILLGFAINRFRSRKTSYTAL
jgi:O-acetyl-ADP-ribose deacetylase (regulator of RNase III)